MTENGPDEEVLQFAISREIQAFHFYMAIADRTENRETRQAFEELAQEELEHKAKLELEIMKLGKTVEVPGKIAPPTRDYIISDTDEPLDMDYKDMLLLAMEKEEASFRTYVNLLPTIKDEASREMLLAIAEEEVKHKLRFEKEYNRLMKQSLD